MRARERSERLGGVSGLGSTVATLFSLPTYLGIDVAAVLTQSAFQNPPGVIAAVLVAVEGLPILCDEVVSSSVAEPPSMERQSSSYLRSPTASH